ncbi:MAG: CRISPR-associated endonuclease Cas6 [Chitinophagales bacterium]
MKKVRLLKVVFDMPLQPWEIPQFRKAIAKKVGYEHILFHNHVDGDVTKFRHAYPLIQYKSFGRKAGLLSLEHGIEELYTLFSQENWELEFDGKIHTLKIEVLKLNQFNMQVWDQNFEYSISNWLALNQSNYEEFRKTDGLADRCAMLERILTGHILGFAKGVDWWLEKQVEVKIQHLSEPKIVKHKNVPFTNFHVKFKTNVFLPNDIGLGKGAARGYGVIRKSYPKQQTKNQTI